MATSGQASSAKIANQFGVGVINQDRSLGRCKRWRGTTIAKNLMYQAGTSTGKSTNMVGRSSSVLNYSALPIRFPWTEQEGNAITNSPLQISLADEGRLQGAGLGDKPLIAPLVTPLSQVTTSCSTTPKIWSCRSLRARIAVRSSWT